MTSMQWRIWALAAAGKFFEGFVVFMTGVALPLISHEFGISAAQNGFISAASLMGILVGAVGLVLGEVLSFSTYFLGHFILLGQASQISLSQPGVLRALIESGVDLAIVGLIGLGIASIVRSSAASLSIFTSIMLVLTVVFFALPGVVVNVVSRYLPANISSTIFSATIPSQLQGTPLFSPLNGLFLMALYAVALLGVGAWMIARRDT